VALPTKATRRYIDALAELQDVLGELNDAAVATQRFAAPSAKKATRALIDPWFASAQQELVRAAHSRLVALQTQPRPWDPRATL
jgi:CHAD domain-containing protein